MKAKGCPSLLSPLHLATKIGTHVSNSGTPFCCPALFILMLTMVSLYMISFLPHFILHRL
uniref:Uncharacterized protein n=1 Tax=Arundo donax TaxID=35708 RepID=A0A0A9ENA5_ARUDO